MNEYATDEKQSVRWCRVMDAMGRYGGGFVKLLAAAWRHADHENHRRLMSAFGHYYAQYAKMSEEPTP